MVSRMGWWWPLYFVCDNINTLPYMILMLTCYSEGNQHHEIGEHVNLKTYVIRHLMKARTAWIYCKDFFQLGNNIKLLLKFLLKYCMGNKLDWDVIVSNISLMSVITYCLYCSVLVAMLCHRLMVHQELFSLMNTQQMTWHLVCLLIARCSCGWPGAWERVGLLGPLLPNMD